MHYACSPSGALKKKRRFPFSSWSGFGALGGGNMGGGKAYKLTSHSLLASRGSPADMFSKDDLFSPLRLHFYPHKTKYVDQN